MDVGYSSDGSDEEAMESLTSLVRLSKEEIINARAAALIMDAMDGEDRPIPAHGELHVKAHVLRRRMLWLVRLWSLLGLLIEFFVEPRWCLDRPDGRCPGEHFYMTGSPKIRQDSMAMLVVNLIYLLPFLLDLSLRLAAYGPSFWTVWLQKCYLLLVMCYGVVSVAEYFKVPTFDLLAMSRPVIFLLLHPTVRREVQVVLRSIPQVCELFFLGFLLLLFFALMAIILFPVTTREGHNFFPSLPAGMWSLLVLMTTANFPDVMMPSYEASRAAVLYFLIFMIVAMFFLVNVLTAIVMSAYQHQGEADRSVLKEIRQKKLSQAYDLLTLDPDTHQAVPLTLERMDAVVEELQRFREFAALDLHSRISQSVDSSGDGIISRSEFGSLVWITKQLTEDSSPPVLERCVPRLAESRAWQAAKSLASSEVPGVAIDILLMLNFIDIIVKLWPEIVGGETAEQSIHDLRAAIAGWVQHTFTVILVLDTLFKVLTLGLHRYLSSHINQFDFAITVAVLMISMLVWLPMPVDQTTLTRMSQCARLFRFCRLLDRYKPYHHFGRIAFKLLPAAVDVVMVVALISYIFAILGVFLFGGVINEEPHNPYFEAVSKSSFGQAKYYVNNFNDLGMGMVTLFELLVVNNWFIISDGFSAACGAGARAYFVAFWALGVLVGLNLFLSTIIGAFIDEYEEVEESHFQLPDFSYLSAAAEHAAALGDAIKEDVSHLYKALPRSNHRVLMRHSGE